MSKQVRWQIPFVSRLGTAYRVDIYDEQDGSWSGVTQLLGGTSPFTTDEDDSDDYFAPIRVQTGTLTVCTHDEDGNVLISLDDILPANNISRPVKLWRLLGGGAAGVLEWQGFLSCEAYDQDYTDIPQHLQLPVISVLEAMASVEVDQAKLSGLNNVGTTIQKLLEIFIDKAGISYFRQYYIPTAARGRNIVSKYIDATVLFEQKEYNNENSITYIIKGLSIKDCLERIAVYMGWCCREVSASLYFFAATESSGYRRFYRHSIIDPSTGTIIMWTPDLNDTAVVTRDIAALLWRGTNHRRTVQQGAKSVAVDAKLEKYDLNISLPEFPAGNVSIYYNELNNNVASEFWSKVWWYMVASQNENAYSNCKLGYWALDKSSNGSYACSNYGQSNLSDVLAHMLQAMDNSSARKGRYAPSNPIRYYAGAFFAKEAFEDTETQVHDPKEGLHCVLFPYTIANEAGSDTPPNFDPSQVGYIVQMSSVVGFVATNGYLNLKSAYEMIYYHWADHGSHFALGADVTDRDWRLGMRLRFGNKYWNGSSWQTTPCLFNARFNSGNFKGNWDETMGIQEADGLLVPISSSMSGEVVLEVWPNVSRFGNYFQQWVCEAFFKQLSVDYIPLADDALTDRSENHYFRLLGTNFRDEISIGTDFASSLNNKPSPSLIMNSAIEAMTELNYGTAQAPDMRRPEVDLLNRLATYYGAARQRLDLIVEHPTAAPLPLLRLNGISPDSRTYAPLAESRDWQQDSSTLKCFETPS